ncbi:MAG: ATP-binding protein [Firmicutes bacterium]|nr:ATP-binding protein [Bacillota bacterium]
MLPRPFQSVRLRVMVLYLLLILFAMELIGGYFIRSLSGYLVENYSRTIAHEAEFLANVYSASPDDLASHPGSGSKFLRPFAEIAGSSVYVLNKDGIVEATSASPFLIGQKRVDEQVTSALLGLNSDQIAVNAQTRARQLYLAVPIRAGHQVIGAVEFVSPMNPVYKTTSRIIVIFGTGTLLALLLTAILAVFVARSITRPITAVTRTARALAAGDFTQRAHVYSTDEIGELAETFNALVERLREAMADTEHEKSRLAAVMEHMTDGVIATDSAGRVVLFNPAASRILNTTEALQHQPLDRILPLSDPAQSDDLLAIGDRMIAISRTSLQTDEEAAGIGGGETLSGGHVIVMRDVTEQARLDEARRRFVADVSHELRTPLTAIKSYVEALLEDAETDPTVMRRFFRVIDRETDRMTRLIRDLLQLSRFDAGRAELHREAVSVRELVLRVRDRFSFICAQKHITLEISELVDETLFADPDALDQVFDNLVSNSIRHTPEGGRITLSARRAPDGCSVDMEVTDTGAGIPAVELPHVFDRFYRVDKARSRRQGGTGLGLAICREIVSQSGGQIDVNSELGAGTSVAIRMPVLALERGGRT